MSFTKENTKLSVKLYAKPSSAIKLQRKRKTTAAAATAEEENVSTSVQDSLINENFMDPTDTNYQQFLKEIKEGF